MGLFIDNRAQARSPGAYAIEASQPRVIAGVSLGFAGVVIVSDWGPIGPYKPQGGGDMFKTYFPKGSARSSTGYKALKDRLASAWCVSRILKGAKGILPVDLPQISIQGTPGAAVIEYVAVAHNATGATIGSAKAHTATANATLSGSNFPRVTWTPPLDSGVATTYDLYRVTGGPSQGKIATGLTSPTFDDTNVAGDSTTPPTTNASGYERAVCYLLDSTGKCVATLVALYPGSMPNGGRMVAQVTDATSADANSFNLTVQISDGVTGSTTEPYPNLKTIAPVVAPTLTASYLLDLFLPTATPPTTRPANGTYQFVGGSDGVGSLSASDYSNGITALALEDDVRVVTTDDCGNSIRAAVATALELYADTNTNCQVLIQGTPSVAWSAVKTDVANYRDKRVIYIGEWVNVFDDSGLNEMQSPFSTFVATALVGLQPQESHAWWDDTATKYYKGMSSIAKDVFNTSDTTIQGDATELGICLPIRLSDGTFAALHDRTTSLTINERFSVTRRINDYLALSLTRGSKSWTNGPMDVNNRRKLFIAADKFMQAQAGKGLLTTYADGTVAYSIDPNKENTPDSFAAGENALAIEATTTGPMEKIFFIINAAPTVTVTTASNNL